MRAHLPFGLSLNLDRKSGTGDPCIEGHWHTGKYWQEGNGAWYAVLNLEKRPDLVIVEVPSKTALSAEITENSHNSVIAAFMKTIAYMRLSLSVLH